MKKLKSLISLISFIFLSIAGRTQTLANYRHETPFVNEPRNYLQAQIYVPSNNLKPTKTYICCSTKKQEPILWIIKIKKKEYVLDVSNANNSLNPLYISKLEVYKDSASLTKYGQRVKNGVIIVTIARKHNKEIFKSLKNI